MCFSTWGRFFLFQSAFYVFVCYWDLHNDLINTKYPLGNERPRESAASLNWIYRQALKETNKYILTIKLHFFIAMMIENVYKACMIRWWQRKKAEESALVEWQQTSAAYWKMGWELKTRALLLVCPESHWDTAGSQSSPDKQPQLGAEEEAAAQILSKKCSSPLVWKC